MINTDVNNLLKKAEEFHGHLGPFLVLGVRMGLFAMKELGCDGWGKELSASVHLPLKTPFTCIVDGIQVATGCTLGKMNIVLRESTPENVWAEFASKKGSLKIRLLVNYHELTGEFPLPAKNLLAKLDRELFTML